MGWGQGVNAEGREVGYYIQATCDQPGCGVAIDRGLAYVCGNMHDGGTWGCGGYFCYSHLKGCPQLCTGCSDYLMGLPCDCGDDIASHDFDVYEDSFGKCEAEGCDCEHAELADRFERREVPA